MCVHLICHILKAILTPPPKLILRTVCLLDLPFMESHHESVIRDVHRLALPVTTLLQSTTTFNFSLSQSTTRISFSLIQSTIRISYSASQFTTIISFSLSQSTTIISFCLSQSTTRISFGLSQSTASLTMDEDFNPFVQAILNSLAPTRIAPPETEENQWPCLTERPDVETLTPTKRSYQILSTRNASQCSFPISTVPSSLLPVTSPPPPVESSETCNSPLQPHKNAVPASLETYTTQRGAVGILYQGFCFVKKKTK